MSNSVWVIILALILTLLGTLTLILITVKFYWGERGTPPLTGEARRQQKEEELRRRVKQIEYSKQNPIATRKSSFWDNSKVYKDK
jgi:hypothetical protein